MREKKRHARAAAIFWWLLAAGWIYLLFYFSRQVGEDSTALSGWFARGVLRRLSFLDVSEETFEFIMRKLAHFGIFAVEGFLVRMALYATKSRKIANTFIALVLCLPLAMANELSELPVSGRSCSVRDMAIDLGGALLGILVAAGIAWICESAVIRRKYRRLRERTRNEAG
jgi:VanZ family protein